MKALWKVITAVVVVAGFVATLEWIYFRAKKAVTWTTDPNRWDSFAMIEIKHKERKRKGELSSQETRAIIEKWFRRFKPFRFS
jgi:hypothetical protein